MAEISKGWFKLDSSGYQAEEELSCNEEPPESRSFALPLKSESQMGSIQPCGTSDKRLRARWGRTINTTAQPSWSHLELHHRAEEMV